MSGQPQISSEIQFWLDNRDSAQRQSVALQWFRDGSIFNKSDAELAAILSSLASLPVPNEQMRHAVTIQAASINHIQMLRYIQKSNAQAQKLSEQNLKLSEASFRLSVTVGILAVVATIAAILQVVVGVLQLLPHS